MRMKFVIYKIKKQFWKLLLHLLLLICSAFLGCSNSLNDLQMKELIFKMPDCTFFDEENIEITRWEVEVQSVDKEMNYFVGNDTKWFKLDVPSNYPVSVTVRPLIQYSFSESCEISFYKTSGGIFPYDFDKSQNFILLSWENGFTAYLMQQLYKGDTPRKQTAEFIQSFNWKKLEEKIMEKTEAWTIKDEAFYNPWLCDIDKILDAISGKSFTATLLNNSKCKSLKLDSYINEPNAIIHSSYIPENQFIKTNGKITIETTKNNFFTYDDYCLVITGSSSKNVSTAIVNLPIFIEEL